MLFKYYNLLFLVLFEVKGDFRYFPKPRSRQCPEYVPKAKPELYGRISERKCREYSWEMNDRIRKEIYSRSCGISKVGVINGKSSKISEFPHMAAIGWKARDYEIKWEFLCGGSLISDRFVLTAAHCTWVRTDDKVADSVPKIVRLGTTYITEKTLDISSQIEEPTDIGIKRMITHERYHSPQHEFDIALFELKKRVKFSEFVQPACLNSEPDLDILKQYKAAGWGSTKVIGDYRSPILQSTELRLLETKDCKKFPLKNRNFDGIQEHHLCATGNNTDTCQGDSGAPLMYKMIEDNEETAEMHMIVGITSFGLKCAMRDTPGIYTKVSYFIDWIEKNVWPEELKSTPKYQNRQLPLQSPKIYKKVKEYPKDIILFPERYYSDMIVFPDEPRL